MKPSDPVVTEVRCTVVGATPATNWVFVEVVCGTEVVGTGEATLSGHEAAVVRAVDTLAERLVGSDPAGAGVETLLRNHPRGSLVWSAAVGGIEQAVEDVRAQRAGLPLGAALSPDGVAHRQVPLYATVNRLLLDDRSPAAFAAAAVRAVEAGFRVVKCAPFDGVRRGQAITREGRLLVDVALHRLRAVRDAVGPDVTLLVDCHGRFDETSVATVLERLADVEPGWVESLVPDDDVRGWQSAAGAPFVLAAGETLTHQSAGEELLRTTPVSVLMPDVKYAGGVRPLFDAIVATGRLGGRCSPHNPSGPVSTLASASAMAASTRLDWVEYALEDVPWRSDLVGGAEMVADGCLVLPEGTGLGLRLDRDLAARHEPRAALRRLGASI